MSNNERLRRQGGGGGGSSTPRYGGDARLQNAADDPGQPGGVNGGGDSSDGQSGGDGSNTEGDGGKTDYEKAVERRREKRRNRSGNSGNGGESSTEQSTPVEEQNPDAQKVLGMAVGDSPSEGQLRNFRNQVQDKLDSGQTAQVAFTGDSLVAYVGPEAERATEVAKARGAERSVTQGSDLSSEDVEIRQNEEGEFSAQYSDAGRQKVEQRAKQQALESERTPGWVDAEDLTVSQRDGGYVVSYSEAAQREAENRARAEAKLEALNQAPEWVGPEDIRVSVDDGQFTTEWTDAGEREAEARARREARLEAVQQSPEWVGPEDLTVRETDEGSFSVTLSEEGQREADQRAQSEAKEQALENEDTPDWVGAEDLDVESNGDGTFTVQLSDEGREEAQSRAQQPEREERFGDFKINIGGAGEVGGPVGRFIPADETRVEDYLRDGAAAYDEWVDDAVTASSKYSPAGITGRAAGEALERVGVEIPEPVEAAGRTGQEFVDGFSEGALQIVNVPGVAVGVKEGVETAGWLGNEAVSGRGGEAVGELGGAAWMAGTDFAEFAGRNKAQSAGMLAGSLVGSVGVMSGAARASGRAGRVTRYAVQPGEEALTEGVNKVVGRWARGQRAIDRLPGGRLDNEEIAIAAGRRVRAEFDQRFNRDSLRTFVADDRAQLDFAGRTEVEATSDSDLELNPELQKELAEFERATRGEFLDESGQPAVGRDPTVRRPREPSGRPSARYREQTDYGRFPREDLRTVDALDRRRAAQRSSFESETEDLTRAREALVEDTREAQVGTDVAQAEVTMEAMRPEFAVDQRPAFETGVDTRPDTRVDIGVDTRVDVGVETELDIEQRLDQDIETELRRQYEYEQEVEQEYEQEFEWETNVEREFESEPSVGGTPDDLFADDPTDFSFDEDRWRTGIATVEEAFDTLDTNWGRR